MGMLLADSEKEDLLGTYQELFSEIALKKNRQIALIWYVFQTLLVFISVISENIKWGIIMFRNFVKLSFRQLKKQKLFSFISISGLTVGVTLFLLSLMYFEHELSYDKYIKNGNEIYRLLLGTEDSRFPIFFAGIPEILRTNDENIDICGVNFYYINLMKSGKRLLAADKILFAEKNIFDYFDIKLINGKGSEAINSPYSIIISEKIAQKYFSGESAIGKELKINNKHKFYISGVFKNIPETSHLKTDFISSFNTYKKVFKRAFTQETMSQIHIYTKAKTKKNKQIVTLAVTEYIKTRKWLNKSDNYRCTLQPLNDIHLYSTDLVYDTPERGNAVYVYASLIAGVFVLLLALFNYINLSEAKNLVRIKEFAIRKVIGSDNVKVFVQALAENFLFMFISFSGALCLAGLSLPKFNQLAMRSFRFSELFKPELIIIVLVTCLAIAFIVSFLPLLRVGKIKPSNIFFNKTPIAISKKRFIVSTKQILITIQMIIAVMLFAGFIAVKKQIDFMILKHPGYEKENILVITNPYTQGNTERYKRLRSELLNKPGIKGISAMANIPGQSISNYCAAYKKGKDKTEAKNTGIISVDFEIFNLLGSRIVKGRNFKPDSEYDVINSIIINETAARVHNISENENQILEGIWGSTAPQQVIGIVEDIYTNGMYQRVEPVIYRVRNWSCTNILVKINSGNMTETVNRIETAWKNVAPHWPFRYSFLDETVNNLYKQDKALLELLKIFSIIAFLLNIIGIFGVVSFLLVQKTKEIGIRKVLGAKNIDIFKLVATEYFFIIIISNVVALFITYNFIDKWLNNFAYKTEIGFGFLLMASFLSFGITFLTVGIKSMVAANNNPVESLRIE